MHANTLLLTTIAMVAFAANSLLCRMALGPANMGSEAIDPASFGTIRVIAGALTLTLIMLPRWKREGRNPIDWRAAAMLSAYVVCFSFAYLTLTAGTGALILFGSVQLTMFAVSLRAGEHFAPLAWAGLALAAGGFVYLVAPGLAAPDPLGATLMSGAGVAWGIYSLLGRGAHDPLQRTATNFIASIPLVALASLPFASDLQVSNRGIVLAILSGALASGLGYVVWYAALRSLSGTQAATVQLSVPIIAAFGGTLLLSEPVTSRLLLATGATIGGIWIVLSARR